jgi:gliding motility-associated-like protein
MKKVYTLVTGLLFTTAAFSQALFNNNGAAIYVTDGAFMIVKTNSLSNTGVTGLINNMGTIVVEGDINNSAQITASGDTIRLSGNWTNNGNYSGTNSLVDMYGGNQDIGGTAVTIFNNLNLGGGSTVKRQQNIDALTSGVLALNDAELATDVNEMLVTNTATTAITRNNGFVSSVGAGSLARATNATTAYNFPTGSPSYVNGPSIFRPIDFTPATTAANVYGAALVKGDATNDGYDVNTVDNILCKVNPNFYHQLYLKSGTDAADLTMYYDATADGDWTDQGHWNAKWTDLGAAIVGSGMGLTTVTVAAVSNFTPSPFALARKKFTVDAGPDVAISTGQSTTFNPTIGAGTGATIDWTPDGTLSCSNCEQPTASPTVTTQYVLNVTDDAGCEVSDSLLVTVSAIELLIPTAFSPNGDGINDKFRVLNKDVVKFNLQIYNRWGEKVYETNDPLDGWDGTYKGTKQPLGVYTWMCDYTMFGQTKGTLAKGNLTLLK